MSVYFIRNKLTGNVKIGWTAQPVAQRLGDLQTGNDGKLELVFELETGTRKTEAFLHKKFWNWHVRGEWFSWSTEIDLFVKRYKPAAIGAPDFDKIVKGLADRLSPGTSWICQCRELAEAGVEVSCGFCRKARAEAGLKTVESEALREQRAKLVKLEALVAIEFKGRPLPTDVLERLLALRKRFGTGAAS